MVPLDGYFPGTHLGTSTQVLLCPAEMCALAHPKTGTQGAYLHP